jgi:MFS family permease
VVQRVAVHRAPGALVPVADAALAPASPLNPAPVVPTASPAVAARSRTRSRRTRQSLLADERFRAFWIARVLASAAHGALIYAFLLIVADQTDRAAFNSLFVVCAILPSILFGLPAGVVADQFPRRGMLTAINLLRFGFVVALLLAQPTLPGIFAATVGLWTLQQFYSPTESAALSGMAPPGRLTEAQSLFNFAATIAQIVGLVTLAPLLLVTLGPPALFAVCAAFFFAAAGLTRLLPPLDDHLRAPASAHESLVRTLRDGLRSIRANPVVTRALAADVLVGIGMSSLVVIVPLYLRRVLDTPAENTVFVFAPAALGLVAGLRVAPFIGRIAGEQRLALAGMLGFALCVGLLGFVASIRAVVNDDLGLPLDQAADALRIPSLVLMTMLISIPAGFCSAVVGVAARSLLLANTHPSRRGQTVATVTLLTGLGALVPTLLAGVAADAFGVERIAVAIAAFIAIAGVLAQTAARPSPLAPAPVPSGR